MFTLCIGRLCRNHSDCSTEVVKEVPLTIDMLQQAQKMNIIPTDASLVTPLAECKHTSYSSWETIKSGYENPKNFGDCYILVEYQMRYCKKCNAAFAREKRTQLSHIMVGSSTLRKCYRCGLTEGIASVEDLQDK